jgi:RNA polymerase sigma-70 factor, ECF subfamily
MRHFTSSVFGGGDLTFAVRLASVLCVEPEVDSLGRGGADPGRDRDQIAEYVRRAQAGDHEGYRELFRLHVRRVHRLVYRLAGPGHDIEDLVQGVFVEAFRALPGFRGDAAFYTWLARIAIRMTLRHCRKLRLRTLPLDEAIDGVAAVSLESDSDARRALASLDRILDSLSDKRRAAFVLQVLEGHSLQEVALLLDATVAAVKVRIHDARVEIERQARRDPYLVHYLRWETTP